MKSLEHCHVELNQGNRNLRPTQLNTNAEQPPIPPIARSAPPTAPVGNSARITPPPSFRSLNSITRRTLLWLVVCVICAIPSFLWAVDEYDRRAMVLGVVLFAFAMVAVTSTNKFYRFSRRQFIRRTLYIGYGIRVAVSIVVPLGMGIDLFSGLMISSVITSLFGGNQQYLFLQTLIITLLQGTALNIMLSILMVIIWSIQKTWMQKKAMLLTSCAKCGYDLIATPAEQPCPECGSTEGYVNFDSTPLARSPWWLILIVITGLVLLSILLTAASYQQI